MTIKSVLVRLRGDNGDLNRALLGSAAASKTLARNLDDADDSSRRLSDSLNTSNERTTMLVQSALALGPALVPIGAQAVPMVMGLTTQLTFAAGAAGVTALAFSGIGDSLKAVNDYAIDPTEANLEKMNEEMAKIGPAGRDFVMYLQEIRPELQRLQDVAQAGMLPGVQEGIEEMMTMLPQVERIVANISETLGDLSAEAGETLAGPEWFDFFNYIETQAQPILTEFSRTMGNLIKGVANMIVAFDPLTRDFSEGFLQMSRDFEAWSDGLADSQGFQNFVTYIRESGPQVWDTLGSLSLALIELVKAAAPVGDVVLPLLEILADSLTAILASPAGPTLVAVAAGISAVSRAIALYNMANGAALTGLLGKLGVEGGKAAAGARMAGVGIGMLGLSLTDLDDKLGLSNTAMFAMMGMMAGPWGAAAGAAAGAIMDATSANDAFVESAARAEDILKSSTSTWDMQVDAVRRAREDYDELQASMDTWYEAMFRPDSWKNSIEGWFGKSDMEEAKASLEELEKQLDQNASSTHDFTGAVDKNSDGIIDNTDAIHDNLNAMRERRSEALRAANAELAFEEAVLDVRDAAKENTNVLKRNGEAKKGLEREAIEARRELNGLAAAWNGQSDAAKNVPGAYRGAIQTFVSAATQMGIGEKQARAMAREILEIPPKRHTQIDVDVAGAMAAINLLAARLDWIDNPRQARIDVAVAYHDAGFKPRGGLQEADGGVVDYYANGGLRESHVAQIAPAGAYRLWAEPETGGEAYIPLAAAKRARSLDIWREVGDRLGARFMEFANGGVVTTYADGGISSRDYREFDLKGSLGVKDIRAELREWRRVWREAGRDWTKSMDRMSDRAVKVARRFDKVSDDLEATRDKLRDLRSDRSAYRREVAGTFDNDIFGNGVAGMSLQLRADANDANAMRKALREAERKGLNGELFKVLAASGDLNTAQQMANLSRSQIRQYERMYAQRAKAQGALGSYAAGEVYNKQIAAQSRLIDRQNKTLRSLNQRLEGLEAAVERGARAGVGDRNRSASQRKKAGR